MARPTTLEELANDLANDKEFTSLGEAEQDEIFQSVASQLDLERTPVNRLIRESTDPAVQEAEERIAKRPSAIQEAFDQGAFGPQGGVGSALLAGSAFFEALESIPANVVLAEQRGAGFKETAEDVLAGMKGERPATLGDPMRTRLRSMGVPSAIATPAAAFAGLELATLGGATQLVKGGAKLVTSGLKVAKDKAILLAKRVKNDVLGRSLREQRTAFGQAEDKLLRPFTERLSAAKAQKNQQIQAARLAREEAQAGLTDVTRKRMRSITEEQQALSQQMQSTAESTVLKIRDKFPALAKKTSNEYRDILNRSLSGLEDTNIPLPELIEKLDSRLLGQPEALRLARKMLGIKEQKAALEGIEGLSEAAQQQLLRAQIEGKSVSVSKVLKSMQKARQGVGRAAKESKRSYTFQEKVADDVASTMVELLEDAGADVSEASAFWAQWAPIRNQAFRDFKPFLKTPTETGAGIQRLIKVSRGKDPGNVRYIRRLEEELGVPLTDDIKVLVRKLNDTQKEKLATQVNQQLQSGQIKTTSLEAMEEARKAYTSTFSGITAKKDAALAGLKTEQIAQHEALIERVAVTKFGANVAKWVVVYQALRRGLNAILPD